MIILDTNIVSELSKSKPDPIVLGWFQGRPTHLISLSSITLAELSFGLHRMPQGRRKSRLEFAVKQVVDGYFEGRILPFDRAAADIYGDLMASLQRSGRIVGQSDLMIAAIALANNAAVATRNVRDFAPTGVPVHNPFEPSA